MASSMPEIGSKISLISKADIRYEGKLFTVDPNECTIALSHGKFVELIFMQGEDFIYFTAITSNLILTVHFTEHTYDFDDDMEINPFI